MGTDKEKKLIAEAIARFPETFKLRAFPDAVFRISESASYFTGPGECGGKLMLYTQRQSGSDGSAWNDFAKGTEDELRGNVR